jgi:hypothetical protein
MVDVTVIREGWDGVGNFFPKEALIAMAKRYSDWREESIKKGSPTAMPVRLGGPDGPPLGHIDSMWYDISWGALRATIDCSTASLPNDFVQTPEEILAESPIVALYRVVSKEDLGEEGSGYKVTEGHIQKVFATYAKRGVRMQS